MRQVFLVLLKKKCFALGEGFAWGRLAKWGVFVFLTNFDGPWTPIQWAKILAQTFFENEMISRVDRALAWPSSMSGTKVMAQKPHFTHKISIFKTFFLNRIKKTCRIRRAFEQLSSYSGWRVITKKPRANLLARAAS